MPTPPAPPSSEAKPTSRSAMLSLLGASVAGAVSASARRLVRGPTRPSWSFGQELFAGVQRAVWGRVADLGVVAFRDASEALIRPQTGRTTQTETEAGGVRGTWFAPSTPEEPVLLYLHGGGYVLGGISTHFPLLDALAAEASWRVFAPEYRLAPEHPRPAAEEDALAVYRAQLESGVPASKIVVAGDSAGGNLALVLLLRLREAGDPLPAAAALVCPWVDLSGSGESFESNADADYITSEAGRTMAAAYLGGADPRDPAVSPLYADLTGLPPLLVQGGGAENLRDQIVAFAERASAQGVKTELTIYADMIHDWHLFGWPKADEAIAQIVRFARDAVG